MSSRPNIPIEVYKEQQRKLIEQEKADGTYYIKYRDSYAEATLLVNTNTPWIQEREGKYYLYDSGNRLVKEATEKEMIKLLMETIETLRGRLSSHDKGIRSY